MAPVKQRYRTAIDFRPDSRCLYIAFNKPYGVLTQFTRPAESDKQSLADFGFPPGVYPLGRLDADSEGLLLLSDDKWLNKVLLSPTFRHRRTYLVQVENLPSQEQLSVLERGIVIQGKKTLPASARLLDGEPDIPPRPVPIRFRKSIPTAWIELSLVEGRNRQVRHMTAAVGCPSLRLVRTAIGALCLLALDLAPGQWMPLSPEQLQQALQ